MYSTLIEVWQYTSLTDKQYIISQFGSFDGWMNANLKAMGVK